MCLFWEARLNVSQIGSFKDGWESWILWLVPKVTLQSRKWNLLVFSGSLWSNQVFPSPPERKQLNAMNENEHLSKNCSHCLWSIVPMLWRWIVWGVKVLQHVPSFNTSRQHNAGSCYTLNCGSLGGLQNKMFLCHRVLCLSGILTPFQFTLNE